MKQFTTIAVLCIFTFALAGVLFADEVPTPTEPPAGVKIVSADEAKGLVEQHNVNIYDMRKALNYGKGHVPGAVSLPYKWTKKGNPAERTGEYDMSQLPADKNAPILFHSDGPTGWKSYYASKAAAEAGYKHVMWMRGGFDQWSEKGYPVDH